MRLFNQVAIIGVGLIGGSIGLAIKKRRIAKRVIGISRRKKTINNAISRRAIDYGSQDLSVVRDSDLIILASPVGSIIQIGIRISSLVKPEAIITDTGSTKKIIVKELENVLPNFVGSHPLAGSEKQGIDNARGDLFCGSLCVLTPTVNTKKPVLNKIKRFWTALGARVTYLSPQRHDEFISCVSHLPHAIAFSLILSVPRSSLFLASTGLSDTTRIASSPEEVWKDIFLTNSKNILKALERFTGSLSCIKSAIMRKDTRSLEILLRRARAKRLSLKR